MKGSIPVNVQALKNFLAVTKHFATFQEDQFDFHSYCVRKMTLRAYVNMLRMEDGILQNEFYAKVRRRLLYSAACPLDGVQCASDCVGLTAILSMLGRLHLLRFR